MRAARLFGIVGVASLCGMSCAQSPPPGLVQPAAAVAAAPAASARQIPRSQASLPTTDAAITVGNFLSLYAVMPPGQRVSMLATHAQFFGALDDYDAALRAADELVKTRPAVAEAWLARAGARQSLHEFQGALADLAQAEKLGADRDAVAAGRAGVWQALGRYDEALAVRRRLVKVRATTATLAAYAVLRGEMGDVADAEAKFLDAQDAFEDVSPFTLAWLYFQNGLVEERAGRPAAARELYEAAHARLPEYAPATGHLATAVALAGDEQRAMALLEPLVAASDDPEYQAQLGVLLRRNGQAARGDELIARAGRRYEALVRRHPDAFADHAARFWLGAGGDAGRALALARRNLAARQTRDAYDLAMRAALAAHDAAAACRFADEAERVPYASAALHLSMSEAFAACRRGARAALELQAAAR
ncbi:MAG TPA: tetratricopeptide repeat protein [Polyangia bacterium]|nr:tetratricopeptide repeat protein [Polyangia bacterium]